ncbi:MAG: MoaD/ThiS family protein [Pirellulaceae bacterium]|nr:MoaD/ThiS family protein [Planctomycetales bacterium]
MKVNVQLFAAARDAAGTKSVSVLLHNHGTVRDLRAALIQDYPQLAAWVGIARFAVNMEYAIDDTALSLSDDVAMIPPVSGG